MADTVQKENIMRTQKMSQLVLFTGIPLMISLCGRKQRGGDRGLLPQGKLWECVFFSNH